MLLYVNNQSNLSNLLLDIALQGILQSDYLSGYTWPGQPKWYCQLAENADIYLHAKDQPYFLSWNEIHEIPI